MSNSYEHLNNFSNDLYGQVIKAQKGALRNVFISPVSIYSAMAMVLAGSKGSTRAQMLRAMKLSESISDDEVHKDVGPSLRHFFTSVGGVSVSLANRLYMAKRVSIESAYKTCLKAYYEADSEQVDFAGEPKSVRIAINNWVADHTMQKILDMIPEGGIFSGSTMMVLNALYFKGKWKEPFEKYRTSEREFTKLDGSKKKIQLMKILEDFCMSDLVEEEARAIKIPFSASKWSMLIILPNKHDGLPKTLSVLQKPGQLRHVLTSEFVKAEVDLRLPRFKLTEGTDMEVGPLLQEMGMLDVFIPTMADLSGICKSEQICLSRICHKAILEVDEEGATAAAASAGYLNCSSAPPEFTVVHPFVVALVYDEQTPIFIGHVTDPEVH